MASPTPTSTRIFTKDKPVIFNFHGYPWLIHRLAYRRTNHANLHVRGYKEKGNINTPLELAISNEIDRFSLAIDVINRVPRLQATGAHVKQRMRDMQIEARNYAYEQRHRQAGVRRLDLAAVTRAKANSRARHRSGSTTGGTQRQICTPSALTDAPSSSPERPTALPSEDSMTKKPEHPAPPAHEHTRTGLSKEALKNAYIDNLFYVQGRFREVATPNDLYMAAAYTVRDRLLERWLKIGPGL